MPPVGTCYLVCVDAIKTLVCVIVNVSTDKYVTLLQVLVDGHDEQGVHIPLKTGNQMSVDQHGNIAFTKPPQTNDPTTQWVPENDLLVNTPAWPDLSKKWGFKAVPGAVTA